jgi:protein TonB
MKGLMTLPRSYRTLPAVTTALFFAAALCACSAQTADPAPVHVSSGVAAGNIVHRVAPRYPAQVRALHIQGPVVLHAIIGKDGSIHNLSPVSGPPLLQTSAMDAVQQWKFKPYLLDGKPVDVETDITINFFLTNH